MLPSSLHERISALNRAWLTHVERLRSGGQQLIEYRSIYQAYTSLVNDLLAADAETDASTQLEQVVALEGRIYRYERLLAGVRRAA